jgi:methylmalonyl-CoA epimerase
MTLEHLGIAVADADAAVTLFTALVGAAPYKAEAVEREGVRTFFIGDGGRAGRAPKLELLEALGPESPVAKFLERRGPGLHHVAFEVDDLPAALTRLGAAGFAPLAEPKPGADGKRVVFFHPRSTGGVLVELVESAPPVERLAVPVEGGELAAFVSGPPDAPPLVVLHGALGSTALMTEPLARRWASDFRVLALDFRAHGASGAFDGQPLTLEGFSADVLALLDAAGAERAHVFGFSMGAAVALYHAWRRPERVGRVVLLGTNVRWVEEETRTMTAAMAAALDDPDGLWARRLAEAHGADRWRALVERSIAFTRGLPERPFPTDALHRIDRPVLVAHGDRDRYIDLRHAVHLYRALPDARLWVLPGLDHPIQLLDAAAFAREAATFLRG